MWLLKTKTIFIVVIFVYLLFFLELEKPYSKPKTSSNSQLNTFINLSFPNENKNKLITIEEILSSGFFSQPNRKFGYSRILDYEASILYNEAFRIPSIIEQEAKTFSYKSIMDDFLLNEYNFGFLPKNQSLIIPKAQEGQSLNKIPTREASNANEEVLKNLLDKVGNKLLKGVVRETVISIQNGPDETLFFFIKQSSGVQKLDELFLDKIKSLLLTSEKGEIKEYYLDWKALVLK